MSQHSNSIWHPILDLFISGKHHGDLHTFDLGVQLCARNNVLLTIDLQVTPMVWALSSHTICWHERLQIPLGYHTMPYQYPALKFLKYQH